jgi:hypothetical protein
MAKATFTNEQLCVAWAKQFKADPQGTRGDVVKDLMGQMGVTDTDAYRKVYNNVTQRKKQLGAHKTAPVTFPELAAGKKGARRTNDQMGALQAILSGDPATKEEEES